MSAQDKYPVSPDNVHLENLVFETIVVKNKLPYYQKWLFKREDWNCGRCGNSQNTVFMTRPTGVVRSCTYCGFTEHITPINFDSGDEMAILVTEKQVSVEEAWELLKKHNAEKHPPAGLTRGSKRRKRRLEE